MTRTIVAAWCCCMLACSQPTQAASTETQMALSVDFQGVWTNPNQHSKVPAGAATRAENVVNPRPGVASTVPGQESLAAYSGSDERFSSGINYQGCIVEHTQDAFDGGAEDAYLYVRDPSDDTLTPQANAGDPAYAYYPPEDVTRIPFAIAGDKLYLATSTGVLVKDGVNTAPAAVGLPAARGTREASTNLVYFESVDVGSGMFAANESAGYRMVYERADADGVRFAGAPSGRLVYTNAFTGSDANPSLRVELHPELVAGDIVKTYRTSIAGAGVDPGDIMYLVNERILDSSDISAGYFVLEDRTPDELRGEPLYTNSTGEGILKQNERPPYAKVMEAFDDSLLLGNVRAPQRFVLRILAIPDATDTLTIAGQTYTTKDSGDPTNRASGEFKAYAGGTVSENIAYTARDLIVTMNRFTGTTGVSASYGSGPNDPPGIIFIEATDPVSTAFTVVASTHGDRYEPPITTAQSSLAATGPNEIWVSKRGQHYAFPPQRGASVVYRFRVGVKGNDILAMAHLRDAVIVFVQGEGVFKAKRVGAEGWRVDQISSTCNLLAPNSVAVLDNQVIALTTRGIVVVDEGGVEEIDLQIKDATLAMRNLDAALLKQVTFGVADEQRLRYILYHPLSDASTTADHAWVYNAEQGTWTERTDPASGGLMGEDGLLYLGDASSNHLTRERTGTASQVYKRPDNTAIPVRIDWTVMDEGDPGAMKQFQELRLLTKDAITGNVTFACTNDLGGQESTTASTVDNTTGEPYVRAWVPDGCQRTSRLNVSVQRSVLSQAFEVVGMKAMVAGAYNGGMAR